MFHCLIDDVHCGPQTTLGSYSYIDTVPLFEDLLFLLVLRTTGPSMWLLCCTRPGTSVGKGFGLFDGANPSYWRLF